MNVFTTIELNKVDGCVSWFLVVEPLQATAFQPFFACTCKSRIGRIYADKVFENLCGKVCLHALRLVFICIRTALALRGAVGRRAKQIWLGQVSTVTAFFNIGDSRPRITPGGSHLAKLCGNR